MRTIRTQPSTVTAHIRENSIYKHIYIYECGYDGSDAVDALGGKNHRLANG